MSAASCATTSAAIAANWRRSPRARTIRWATRTVVAPSGARIAATTRPSWMPWTIAVAREEQQHVELALAERDRLAADRHGPRRRVDLQPVEAQRRLGLAGGVDAAQHGVDARDELGRRERLDHVVVGAQPQADDAVGL